ncbi:hypothetical protein [Carbonactinospora thermoautotrophica]|uniref:hypothetical protein n=1 Tax=Carbonactinospora thermoautotrophica TaxID=1469144 RepID=UPI002270E779|nr:hypothetical protein [Carbonactinospora thermoautotrophica]
MNNLERLIAHLDPQSARFATAALDWLLPQGGDLDDLTQIELQDFLWLQLPAVWPVPIELQLEVAEALAELFTLSGHRRLADVCRSPRTRAVFGAWAEGLGLTAYRQAMEASGVEPPNTGRITWSHVMGAGEGEVRREIGRLLEARIDQDAVRAGSWEWRAYAAELTDEFLVTPHERWPGRLPIQVVEEARLRLWLLHGSPGRRVLLQPVVPQLTREAEPSPEALAVLEPLRWLLERLRAGLVLTKTGRLPLSVVAPAAALFGWTRERPPRSEQEVTRLSAAFALLRAAGLVQIEHRRAYTTALGNRAIEEPAVLWRVALGEIFSGEGFDAAVAELAAALLLRYTEPLLIDLLLTLIHIVLAGEWNTPDGDTFNAVDLACVLGPWLTAGEALGCVRQTAEPGGHAVALTPLGREIVSAALRARALRPRRVPLEE